MLWVSGGAGNQCMHMFFREADEDDPILTGIGGEDIGKSRRDDHEETILTQSPGRVLARGPAGEVLLCDEDLSAQVLRSIENEVRIGLGGVGPFLNAPPVEEEKAPLPGAPHPLRNLPRSATVLTPLTH